MSFESVFFLTIVQHNKNIEYISVPMAKTCPYCGVALSSNAETCPSCYKDLSDESVGGKEYVITDSDTVREEARASGNGLPG
jgi:RNA polymerase subunit RPABC4/transcription elongation factor Spt4